MASSDYEHYKKNGWLPITEINNPIASVLKKVTEIFVNYKWAFQYIISCSVYAW